MTNQNKIRGALKDVKNVVSTNINNSTTDTTTGTTSSTTTTSQCCNPITHHSSIDDVDNDNDNENDFEKCNRRRDCHFNHDDADAADADADADADSKKDPPDDDADKESPAKKQKRVTFLFHDTTSTNNIVDTSTADTADTNNTPQAYASSVDNDNDNQHGFNANNICSSGISDDLILMPPPASISMTRENNIEFANGNCIKEQDYFDIDTATRTRTRSNAIDLSSSYSSSHNRNHDNNGGGGGQSNDGANSEEEDGIDITLYDSHSNNHNHHLHQHRCDAMAMQEHSHGADMNVDMSMDHIHHDMEHVMPPPNSASIELHDSSFERNDIDTCTHHHRRHLDDDGDDDHDDHGCILARNPDIHQEEDGHVRARIHSHVDILHMEESLQHHRQGDDDDVQRGEIPHRDAYEHEQAHVDILHMEESVQHHRQDDDEEEEQEGGEPHRNVHEHEHTHTHAQIHPRVDILHMEESLHHHRQGGNDEEQGGEESHRDVQEEGIHEEKQQHPNEDANANSNGNDSDSGSKLKPTITTRFSDIIGHGAAKLRLDEMLLPLALPPYISQQILVGVRAAPASILLYGPPGTGKTKLAQAVAGEAGAAFLSIGPSDVLSKFVGESEAAVKGLFRRAKIMAKRMESRCAVVFFDEIDALGMSRGGGGEGGGGGGEDSSAGHSSRKILAELLIQMSLLSDEARAQSNGCTESSEEAGTDNGNTDASPDIDIDNGIVQEGSDSDFGLDSESASRDEIINEDEHDHAHGECSGKSSNKYNNGRGVMVHNNRPQTVSESRSSPPERPQSRVIVIAATNRPEDCDAALLRRFSIRVLVGLPSQRDRRRILSRLLEGIDNTITPADLKELSVAMEGWSGSDLESVTREAVMAPIRECLRSAAVLKMNARKRASADGNKETMVSSNDSDGTDAARDELLNKFRKLRPVTMQDFEEAIAFWIGDGQEDMTAQMTNQAAACHYDSDSSFDENE